MNKKLFKGRMFVLAAATLALVVGACGSPTAPTAQQVTVVQTAVVTREVPVTLTPALATCGDGTCNGSEGCNTCPADCGLCSTAAPTAEATVEGTVATVTPTTVWLQTYYLYVGNQTNHPNATELECYSSAERHLEWPSVWLPTSMEVKVAVIGRLDPERDLGEWVAVPTADLEQGYCWLAQTEVTLPEGIEWGDLPIFTPQ